MCWTIFPVVSKLFTIFDGIKDEFYAEFGTKLRDFNKKKHTQIKKRKILKFIVLLCEVKASFSSYNKTLKIMFL